MFGSDMTLFVQVAKVFKQLNKYFVGEFNIPNHWVKLPPKELILRSVMIVFIEQTLVPAMWTRGPSYAGKAGIVCVFNVMLQE